MKKTFLRILPLMAAVLLASSCGKDDDNSVNPVVNNNETEQQPTENVAENEYVTIPFSVGIAADEGLSKITCESYTDDETGKKKVKRSFGAEDVGKTLTVTGDDIQESKLTYQNVGTESEPSYKFTGSIKVKSGKVSDFTDGKVKMRGVLGTPLTELSASTVSLSDAMTKYAYEVCEKFYSDESKVIQLTDQNAYLYFKLATTQTKLKLDIAGSPFEYGNKVVDGVDQEPFKVGSDYKELWVAVPGGSEVKGNLVSTKGNTANAGKVITIDRHDVVDLGPTWNILWKTTNETGGTATSYNQSDKETSAYKDEKYYTWSNACAFGRMNGINYVKGTADPFRLPTQAEFEALAALTQSGLTTHNGMACKEFSNDYGSVFFPAAGDVGGYYAGSVGYYWSGESGDGGACFLNIFSGIAYVDYYDVSNEFSVRLVRGL